MENTTTQGYKIATDEAFLEKLYPTPKGLESKMPKLYQMALKGKSTAVDLILKEIKRYPKYPDLKTILSLAYSEMGLDDKADEIQLELADKHPEYFTGRLNTAFIHFDREEYHLMEKVLSKGFDLKTMYPERDEFHIQEVVLMQKAAVFYYGAIGDIEQAKIRLEIMEKLAPESEDFQIASDQLNINTLHHRLKGTGENSPLNVVRNAFSKINALVKRPKFHFEIINELFEYGHDIPQGLVDEIMELPRKELIEDLEAIIKFSVENFEEISSYPTEEKRTFYVSHAIYLLADLEAYESFSIVIDVFKQNEDYNQFYFGDFITEILWDPLMRLSSKNLPQLMEYMKLPDIYTYSRALIPEVLEQMIYHYPEKKEEALTFFEDLLLFYNNTDDETCIDVDLIGLIIWTLTCIRDSRFNLLITQLYEKKMVEESIVGSLESVLETIARPWESYSENALKPLIDRYHEVFEEKLSFDKDKFDDLLTKMVQSPPYPESKNSTNDTTKIQRNDPCPCGSGKKYKKCCLNK
jgi:tetratricopeptide (TPR) repeat protein